MWSKDLILSIKILLIMFMLKEKFQILPKKKEVIVEYMPILKRVIEEEG
jgi:hypothetical protein